MLSIMLQFFIVFFVLVSFMVTFYFAGYCVLEKDSPIIGMCILAAYGGILVVVSKVFGGE